MIKWAKKHARAGSLDIPCANCGKIKRVPKHHIEQYEKHYCSARCQYKNRWLLNDLQRRIIVNYPSERGGNVYLAEVFDVASRYIDEIRYKAKKLRLAEE